MIKHGIMVGLRTRNFVESAGNGALRGSLSKASNVKEAITSIPEHWLMLNTQPSRANSAYLCFLLSDSRVVRKYLLKTKTSTYEVMT